MGVTTGGDAESFLFERVVVGKEMVRAIIRQTPACICGAFLFQRRCARVARSPAPPDSVRQHVSHSKKEVFM